MTSSPILLDSRIQPVPWSEHCAVITTISSLIPQTRDRTWCINDLHLVNKSYCFDIQQALKEYLLHNASPDISPVLLWEAHKPVIRGTCISVSSHLNRDKKIKLQHLKAEYHQLFRQFQSSPTELNRTHLEKTKTELDLLLAETTTKSIPKLISKIPFWLFAYIGRTRFENRSDLN